MSGQLSKTILSKSSTHRASTRLQGWVDPEHRQRLFTLRSARCDARCGHNAARAIITELMPGETRKIALRWTLYDGMG